MSSHTLIEIVELFSRKIGEMEAGIRDSSELKELTFKQVFCLEMINNMRNPSLSELARALRITKPSTTVLVDKLVKKGYITRVQSDEDRRSAHLHLTDKGHTINELHDEAHRKFAGYIEKSITTDENEILLKLLNKVSFINH